MNKLEAEIRDYSAELEHFSRRRLPETLLKKPDHIAIKAYDSLRFERLLQEVERDLKVDNIVTEEMHGQNRRIATAFLAGTIAVKPFGEVRLLEIMEPRPENVGTDKVGLDHVEFFVPNLKVAELDIQRSGIGIKNYQVQSNSNHDFIAVKFGEIIRGEYSRELKFTNISLADISKKELKAEKTGENYDEVV